MKGMFNCTNEELDSFKVKLKNAMEHKLPDGKKTKLFDLKFSQAQLDTLDKVLNEARNFNQFFGDFETYNDFSILQIVINNQVAKQKSKNGEARTTATG